jgi:hypothetical protein
MPDFDLSNYDGRQAARDAGYWVGDDGGGNIVAEYTGTVGGDASPGAPMIGGGGGGGGGQAAPQQQFAPQSGGGNAELQRFLAGLAQAGADDFNLRTTQINNDFAIAQEQNRIAAERLGLERDQLALDRERATNDMQLARNADARGEAMLRIEQADLALRQNAQARAAVEFDMELAENKRQADQTLAEQKRQAQRDEFLREAQISGTINGLPTEAARQFNVTTGENQRQFDITTGENRRQFDTSTYTNLANTLLSGAANLRGPRDWTQYAQFLGGGNSLTNQLFGGQAGAAFGAPSGLSPAIRVSDVMGNLGFLPGQNVPQPGGSQQVPLPHQINPAVWDRMGQSARDLALGMAESGNTSAGSYTPEDYERLINASRPQGQASRVTRSQFASPMGVM